MRAVVVVVVAITAMGAGCDPAHISSYTPKQREAPTLSPVSAVAEEANPGSLFSSSASGGSLFVDARAYRVNDVVVVRVEERADAERSASTDTSHKSWAGAGITGLPLLGPLLQPLLPGVALPTSDLESETSADLRFEGRGDSGRSESLVATVSTMVKAVMPNGNLYVEGHRVILVNQEEHHLYVSGLVRPIDIDDDNAIDSSRIAEAHIEFVGQGVLTDAEAPGWLARIGAFLWPF